MKCRHLFAGIAPLFFMVACAQPDPGITTSVKAKLAADDLVKARRIDVETKDRVVTLSGTVESQAEENQAVRVARETSGVSNVVDKITVAAPAPVSAPAPASASPSSAPSSGPAAGYKEQPEIGYAPDIGESAGAGPTAQTDAQPATDASINSSVKAALQGPPALRGMEINVVTRDGVVTLSGTVLSEQAKTRAGDVAGSVDHVTRVDNQLVVEPNR